MAPQPIPLPRASALPPPSHRDATTPSPCSWTLVSLPKNTSWCLLGLTISFRDLEAGLGLVWTNVRIQSNPVCKAFHRIRFCEDTYLDKTLREFACYFDADNRIQVVVPWLGKDYAFLKKENRDRVRGQDDTLLSDLGQAQMGVDMLLGPFLSSSHSSQAFCGTKLIVRY